MRAKVKENRAMRVYAHFSRRQRDGIIIPEIKLQGIYLEDAGFNIGDKINVEVVGERITISKGGSNG
jgi:hypothetical protein